MRRILAFAALGGAAALALVVLAPWRRADGPREPVRGALYDAEGRAIGDVPTPARRPNFVVVVIDTLRADALDVSDAGPGMPFLRSLAAEGVSFSQASAPAPWTKPSLTSLLTAILPHQHGNLDSRRSPALAAGITTFAEVLSRSHGYETVAFMDTPLIGGPRGALQGFTHADHGYYLQATDHFVGRWAASRDRSKPFLLVLHTYEAHEPYGSRNHPWPPPPEVPAALGGPAPTAAQRWDVLRTYFLDRVKRTALANAMGRSFTRILTHAMGAGFAQDPQPQLAADLRRAYLEGTTWVDGLLRDAVGKMRELGLLEDTVLVVTSDHGESFGEHGQIGHGRQMYDELLRIPLVMQGPAPFRGGRTIDAGVGLIDVLPTLLDHAKIPPPGGIDGRSFLGCIERGEPGWPVAADEVLSEDNTAQPVEATVASVRTPRWKWIITYERVGGTVVEQLYDLAVDPGERTDVMPPADRPLEVGDDACRAIRAVRDRIWRAARGDQERVGTPYGASIGTLRAEPRADCR
jgi:arylsulfatase A-like enzyme